MLFCFDMQYFNPVFVCDMSGDICLWLPIPIEGTTCILIFPARICILITRDCTDYLDENPFGELDVFT